MDGIVGCIHIVKNDGWDNKKDYHRDEHGDPIEVVHPEQESDEAEFFLFHASIILVFPLKE